jgi:16S rRNA processing protein RimM
MSDDDLLVVGKITGCYGIKGWVKVHSYTDPPENIFSFGRWRVKRRGEVAAIEFDASRPHGKGQVAHIAGVDDRTLAESFRGLEIWAPEDALPALEEGEYYWRQLEGLQVWCLENGDRVLLGEVDYLIETGANDVLVVKACEGSVDERERLIPYLPGDTVTRVDLDEALMEVDWFVDEDDQEEQQ